MTRFIPNANTWVGFRAATVVSPVPSQTAANLTAAVDITSFVISVDASTRGNVVTTPSLDSLFETSIPGTVTGTVTAEFYRDKVLASDTAWTTFARGTEGYLYIDRRDSAKPIAADTIEVWPVRVISRSASSLTNNESQRFTVEFAVPVDPNEALVVAP